MYFKNIFINGPKVIELKKFEDDRGFFARFWCKNELNDNNIDFDIKQINNSLSLDKGTLRGLHFQYPPKSEGKIVRCIVGSIWDVIVDVRKNSKTFGKWFGIELNQDNKKMLYVPKGFAHGFISLSNNAEILYLVSENYAPENEEILLWSDKKVNIKWPKTPIHISKKDSKGKKLEEIKEVNL
tara:strand:+ start:150 stop:698 length:549 start_codon:yes stop_codon:yes gene_type:complete